MGQILDDVAQERPMSRLLQGDVGSGKTVVAAAALLAAKSVRRARATMMAPTEILAEQHFQTLCRMLSGSASGPAPTRHGSPALPGEAAAHRPPHGKPAGAGEAELSERRWPRARSTSLVGTHAVIQEGVSFRRLGARHRRRAAPLRRDAAGGPARQGAQPARAGDDRHAHPAHPGPHPLRRPGHLGHRRDAAGPQARRDALGARRRRGSGPTSSCGSRCGRGGRRSSSAR